MFLVFLSIILQNFTLVIERVEPYDGAKYVCEITAPEMSITHVLEVNGAILTLFSSLLLRLSKHEKLSKFKVECICTQKERIKKFLYFMLEFEIC